MEASYRAKVKTMKSTKNICKECGKRVDGKVDKLLEGKCLYCRDINVWFEEVGRIRKQKKGKVGP